MDGNGNIWQIFRDGGSTSKKNNNGRSEKKP